MKTNTEEKQKKVKTLNHRLTAAFIAFAFVLMGMIWVMQAGLLTKYYEYSMEKKVENSIESIETVYSTTKNLTYDDFCDYLGDISGKSDIQFIIEATDASFRITSSDITLGGRMFPDSMRVMSEIYDQLTASETGKVSQTKDSPNGLKTYIHARTVSPDDKIEILIVAIASLTPLGPAVSIIRSLLLVETVIALVLCFFVARYLSKHLSTPIVGMNNQAKQLAKGNLDVKFYGGNEFLEIDELAETLTETASELKKSDSLQKDLMANVSHDLRTPLTMIKSYAEMIRDLSGDIPEKRDEHLGVIIEETDRLSDLVNDVLTLSKMQAGVTEIEEKVFDFTKSVESVLSTYMVMEQDGYRISFEKCSEDVLVKGDERKLQQVVGNLLSNAVRYSENNKEITVSIEAKEGRVRLSVKDRGIGIAREDIEKIWHRYERASREGQRTKQGTGLGLSIAAEILEKHNAKYGVESEEGMGSTFWFELQTA